MSDHVRMAPYRGNCMESLCMRSIMKLQRSVTMAERHTVVELFEFETLKR